MCNKPVFFLCIPSPISLLQVQICERAEKHCLLNKHIFNIQFGQCYWNFSHIHSSAVL